MYYVYLVRNEKDELYIGYTEDLERRLEAHNAGINTSTKGHTWQYVYYEAYLSEKDAKTREAKLKRHGQSKRHLKERIAGSLQLQ